MPGVFRKPFHRGPRSRRRAFVVPTYTAPPPTPFEVFERRPVPPHVYDRPDISEYSRRRRRLAPRRVVSAVVAEACRLTFTGIEREALEFIGNDSDPSDPTMGRPALEFSGVWCREDL